MTVCILKPCTARHEGALINLKAGDLTTFPDNKEDKLIQTGWARKAMPSDYRTMVQDFNKHQGDCWGWIKQHQPEVWRRHVQALHKSDISTARLTYNTMIAAWSSQASNYS